MCDCQVFHILIVINCLASGNCVSRGNSIGRFESDYILRVTSYTDDTISKWPIQFRKFYLMCVATQATFGDQWCYSVLYSNFNNYWPFWWCYSVLNSSFNNFWTFCLWMYAINFVLPLTDILHYLWASSAWNKVIFFP